MSDTDSPWRYIHTHRIHIVPALSSLKSSEEEVCQPQLSEPGVPVELQTQLNLRGKQGKSHAYSTYQGGQGKGCTILSTQMLASFLITTTG